MSSKDPSGGASRSGSGDPANTQDSRPPLFAGPSHRYGDYQQGTTPGVPRVPLYRPPVADLDGGTQEPPPPYQDAETGIGYSNRRAGTADSIVVPERAAGGSVAPGPPAYSGALHMRYPTDPGHGGALPEIDTTNITGAPFVPSPAQMTPDAMVGAARYLNQNPSPAGGNPAHGTSRRNSDSHGQPPAERQVFGRSAPRSR